MVDVTAGQGVGSTNAGFPTLTEIGNILKRGDIALALGVLTILVVLILPLPAVAARPVPGDLDHALGPDPDDVAVHPGSRWNSPPSRPSC